MPLADNVSGIVNHLPIVFFVRLVNHIGKRIWIPGKPNIGLSSISSSDQKLSKLNDLAGC